VFNACAYLLDRRLEAGDGGRLAITGPAGDLTYAQLLDRVQRAATVLAEYGLLPEQRMVMFMSDSPEWVVLYLAAMRIGAIPVPVSTMLHADGLAELIRDSRARLLAATDEFTELAAQAATQAPELRKIILPHDLDQTADPTWAVYSTIADSPAFWLYTSGTTGKSKAAMHRHASIPAVCETYGSQVLGIRPDDRCLSAAKAFFAYGLGNSVLFPLSAGATAVLEPKPARPDLMAERIRQHEVSLFFAGPTFFAGMLRADLDPDPIKRTVRLAASAGEALPAALYERWTTHFGVDILDGIGMTEMLHIFLSNREGQVRPGTTGLAVPGYELKILDDDGAPVQPGTPGTLFVRGDSTATGYWSRFDASRTVFQGEWLRTGDTYVQDPDGYYTCLRRTGDMLKASGIWVSPAEVEGRLLKHESVAQAIVVAGLDADGLEKPVAFVIRQPGRDVSELDLIEFCRAGLPTFTRPRRIIFTDTYPTTSTGKVRRVELRDQASAVLTQLTALAGDPIGHREHLRCDGLEADPGEDQAGGYPIHGPPLPDGVGV
jgi:benzoate-CoA ligase family protein